MKDGRSSARRSLARFAALLLLPVLASPVRAGDMEQAKVTLEKALEERIQSAVGKFVDTSAFLVMIKVEPYTADEWKQKASGGGSGSVFVKPRRDYILPGIPERARLQPGQDTPSADIWQGKPFVKRLLITLFLDKRIPDGVAQQVEILVKQMVDFSPERKDELKIERILFRREDAVETAAPPRTPVQHLKVSVDQLKGRSDFYWILIALVVSVVLVVFFLSLMVFMRKFLRLGQELFPVAPPEAPPAAPAAAGRGENGNMSGSLKLELGGAPLSVNMSAQDGSRLEVFVGEPEKRPYHFINDKDIVNILLLMKDEPPLHLAIIAYHMRPDLAAPFLSGLDAAVRKQVADCLAAPQLLMQDEAKALGQSLKQKVRGIISGVDQFFAIYDSSPPNAQAELMKSLEAQTPVLAEKMRNEMFSFEDLMSLDPAALRVVFREVPLRTLAVALMGSAAPARDRILTVLPAGAAEIIRQEIEMNASHSQKSIEDERKKIVAVVRRLVWDKKIVMPSRQKNPRLPKAVTA